MSDKLCPLSATARYVVVCDGEYCRVMTATTAAATAAAAALLIALLLFYRFYECQSQGESGFDDTRKHKATRQW